jgi:predicted AlkP superfamily phosphohydrolase/phosphomutase
MMITRWATGGGKTVLFDNAADRYQLQNIAKETPAVVKELTDKLNAILKELNDPWLG